MVFWPQQYTAPRASTAQACSPPADPASVKPTRGDRDSVRQTANAHRCIAVVGRAVAELAAAVIAPARDGAGAQQRAVVVDPARDRTGAGYAGHPHRRLRVDLGRIG